MEEHGREEQEGEEGEEEAGRAMTALLPWLLPAPWRGMLELLPHWVAAEGETEA